MNAPRKCPIKLFPGSENGRLFKCSAAVIFCFAEDQSSGDCRTLGIGGLTLDLYGASLRARGKDMLLTSRSPLPIKLS